jgi:hypothetical protein
VGRAEAGDGRKGEDGALKKGRKNRERIPDGE